MSEHIIHPFEPFFRPDSKILIVGSLPSVKSRENGFYYGHPQNRFWKMLAQIFAENTPTSIEEKQRFLEKHKIAVYDSIKECTISGSSDSSIRDVIPSDIEKIVSASKISKILANGKTAAKYFLKYQNQNLCRMLKILPSTSPANATFALERLVEIWGKEFSIQK